MKQFSVSSQQISEVVYTWVDDSFPDYRAQLARHAGTSFDLAPNRTRDNLDLLKYSLRSLDRFAPWVSRVTLVSMRPQIPAWLDPAAPGLRIIHHDAFMPAEILPTFSSFAILSCLAAISDLAQRFLYLEDDLLLTAPLSAADLMDEEGRMLVFPERRLTAQSVDEAASPWNQAMANSNRLLDEAYGKARRPSVMHVPLLIDRDDFAGLAERWPEEIGFTRRSKFRAPGTVAPEHLYPWRQLYEGRASLAGRARFAGYHGIENSRLINAIGLRWAMRHRPTVLTLNDNIGAEPRPSVEAAMRRWLERRYPTPSRFERRA